MIYTNGYSTCACPSCVLENGGVSECYTGVKQYHNAHLMTNIQSLNAMTFHQQFLILEFLTLFTGTTLAFVAYPAAIAKMPGSVVWAILFFLMLMMIGLGTMCISVHTVVTAIIDEYPRQLYKHRLKVLLAICVAMYLMGLPFLSQVSRNNLGFYFSKCRDLRLFRSIR